MPPEETIVLRDLLARHTRAGDLYTTLPNSWVQCHACGHRCKIPPGRDGICKVRFNDRGLLYVPHGYAAGIAVDPIEKKPFFHAFPGSNALSFGMLGCDYHCCYCQNWITSQALRDPVAGTPPTLVTAEKIVSMALEHRTPVITSTYNEPLITSEWAVEIFRLAMKYHIACSYVSNGNGTQEVIDYLRPYLRLWKVDLKSFHEERYRQLGGTLGAVLETIREVHRIGIWIEVVTLVVPGFNDSEGELEEIAEFLAGVSPDIPWHVTAFHQDYRMMDPLPTTARTLNRAAAIGRSAGLRFVYAGNLPGQTGSLENTFCPSCDSVLIERRGFHIIANRLQHGACHACGTAIPGVWE
jgi:pyruvate formate lyase activating enzyme